MTFLDERFRKNFGSVENTVLTKGFRVPIWSTIVGIPDDVEVRVIAKLVSQLEIEALYQK